MTEEKESIIMAQALFGFLKDGEGVVVHWDGIGYCVARTFDKEKGCSAVAVYNNESYLEYPDLSHVRVMDEVAGNA